MTHFATLEKMVFENNLKALRILNVEECGVTPEKDFSGRLTVRFFLPRKYNSSEFFDIRLAEWSYDARITMMQVM